MTVAAGAGPRPNLRSIALPAEHGGWGLLLEPVLLGLVAAFSGAGLLLVAGVLGAFLLHQPLKIAAKDHLKGRQTPRTRWAERFALLYAGVALLAFALLIGRYGLSFLLPLLLALPLVLLQLRYDLQNRSRHLLPELSGAAALGAIAPGIALLAGWALLPALLLWLISVLRGLPTILYVRARLRLERDKAFTGLPVHLSHLLALALSLPLVALGHLPLITALALALLLLRAFWGLSPWRKAISRPAIIGFRELFYGIAYALALGVML